MQHVQYMYRYKIEFSKQNFACVYTKVIMKDGRIGRVLIFQKNAQFGPWSLGL